MLGTDDGLPDIGVSVPRSMPGPIVRPAASLRPYQNRSATAARVTEKLIQLPRHMREAHTHGGHHGLIEDELALCDALGTNDSANPVLGDETPREIVHTVRHNVK